MQQLVDMVLRFALETSVSVVFDAAGTEFGSGVGAGDGGGVGGNGSFEERRLLTPVVLLVYSTSCSNPASNSTINFH